MASRDRGCVFPGCDRPPGRCRSHHIVHWVDGGRTDLDDLCLLCEAHHDAVHDRGFGLTRDPDGAIVVTRPDGQTL
ncbi:MAG TPA: HNH endonuclease signature motif containing protein [Acidimicrobiales bacterium]|nr:HNH endonuclease signature motif containing protein [Acidimicrobiales bacterium]